MPKPWQIWIDTGGTFTDCIAEDPDGVVHTCKVLSSGALRDRVDSIDDDGRIHLRGGSRLPDGFLTGYRLFPLGGADGIEILEHEPLTGALLIADSGLELEPGQPVELSSGEEAPLVATRLITGTPFYGELPPVAMRLATTRGTNALLERRGAKSIHFTTAGFEDLLLIGDQTRPDLFALQIERPKPLPEEVVGVEERLRPTGFSSKGSTGRPSPLRIANLRRLGFESASIALLHGHRNAQHEEALEALLRSGGFDHVSRSSSLCPFQGLLKRSQTATTDAYLGPVISNYLNAVRDGLGDGAVSLHVMTSAGGLVNTDSFRAMDSLLSGPAGGVVGAASVRPRVRESPRSSPSTWAAPAPMFHALTTTSSTYSIIGSGRWNSRHPPLPSKPWPPGADPSAASSRVGWWSDPRAPAPIRGRPRTAPADR